MFTFGRVKRSSGALLLAVSVAVSGSLPQAWADASTRTNFPAVIDLKLDRYLQLVARHNETLQAQMMETEVGRLKARAEWGVFEPGLTTSAFHEDNKRRNNIEEQAAQGGQPIFSERNTIYDGAIESLVPTGAKVRLGANLSDLKNNLSPLGVIGGGTGTNFTRQYQTFVGVSLTQPLLKNGGTDLSMANIRIAAMESTIAFQQYRRQLMLAISQAEAAYWNLYFAEEQLKFFKESVGVAESILADSRERMKAGRGSELDVLEAQAGLALRQTKRNEALQNFYEALGQVQSLSGTSPTEQGRKIHAADVPPPLAPAMSYPDSFRRAFDSNPDYLIQREKIGQEKLRLGVAKNQLLPELNMKGAYGYNGLGSTPGDSYDVLGTQDFPSWSIGLEMRIPLGGGFKERNLFNAAKLTLQEAVVNARAMETQISNALEAGIRKTQGWQDSIHSYQTVVEFNESLLKTQVERLNAGRIEPRKVFEVEADLFDARQNLAQALVQRQRTLLEVQLAEGTVLKARNLEITRDELRQRTKALLSGRPLVEDAFHPLINEPGSISN